MRTPELTNLELDFIATHSDVIDEIIAETIADKAFYVDIATNIHENLDGFVFGISEIDGDAEYFECDNSVAHTIFEMCGFKKCNNIFATLNLKTNNKQSAIIRTYGNFIKSIPVAELERVYRANGYNPEKFNAGIASEICFNGYFNSSPSLNDFDNLQMKVSLSRNYQYMKNGKLTNGKSSGQSDILVIQLIKEFDGKIYRLANSKTVLKTSDFHEMTIKYHHNKKKGDYSVEYVPHNRQFKNNWERHKTETLLYVPID